MIDWTPWMSRSRRSQRDRSAGCRTCSTLGLLLLKHIGLSDEEVCERWGGGTHTPDFTGEECFEQSSPTSGPVQPIGASGGDRLELLLAEKPAGVDHGSGAPRPRQPAEPPGRHDLCNRQHHPPDPCEAAGGGTERPDPARPATRRAPAPVASWPGSRAGGDHGRTVMPMAKQFRR